MPETLKLVELLFKECNAHENTIVFIEKIVITPRDYRSPQKMNNLLKIKAQYDRMIALLITMNIRFIEVMPVHWQKEVGYKSVKGASYDERKRGLKQLAVELCPSQKVTLWNCDALLILYFGLKKCKFDQTYIWSKIEKHESFKNIF